jgi:ABC-type transport system substrate-binding protein
MHPRLGYWQRLAAGRLRRRRLFAGAIGAMGMALLGCKVEDEPPASNDALLSAPFDTTVLARAGGSFRGYLATDASSFDPLASGSFLTHSQVAAYTYPRLLKFLPGVYPSAASGEVEGDLVEAAEASADRLQLTLRLRHGLRWEQKAPTNGRAIDAQDVLFSWGKFSRLNPAAGDLAFNAESSPGAPIESVTSPDPRTVVLRLKQPDAALPGLLAGERLLYVMPRESDGGFDPRFETRGYGPWLMSENRPGIVRVWSKNPEYHVKGRPFIDRIEQPFVPEYGARLAQFRAGLIWSSVVSQNDVVSTKRDLPELLLRSQDNFATAPSSLAFGYDGDSPWKDERLRQAVSLLIDRETLIDLKTNRQRFAAEGLSLAVRYHSAVGAGWDGYWVDPTDEAAFGPNARYFRYDPAEARRLMSAAGYPDGIDTLLHYAAGSEGAAYVRTAELLSGMLHEGDVRARLDPRPPERLARRLLLRLYGRGERGTNYGRLPGPDLSQRALSADPAGAALRDAPS